MKAAVLDEYDKQGRDLTVAFCLMAPSSALLMSHCLRSPSPTGNRCCGIRCKGLRQQGWNRM